MRGLAAAAAFVVVSCNTHSLTVPFIKHFAVAQGFTDQRVALGVTAGGIVRTASQQIHRERRINPVKDFQGLPEVPSLERKYNEQANIRVRARVSVSV